MRRLALAMSSCSRSGSALLGRGVWGDVRCSRLPAAPPPVPSFVPQLPASPARTRLALHGASCCSLWRGISSAGSVHARPGSAGKPGKGATRSGSENASTDSAEDIDDFLDSFVEEEDEESGPQISDGGVEWGARSLAVVQRLLPASSDVQLYSFRVVLPNKLLHIRLDKLSDQYGSPSLDEVTEFSRSLAAALEAELGQEEAGDIEVEVSSAGAEREVRVPGDLARFANLPMQVISASTAGEGGAGAEETRVLQFVEVDEVTGVTRWQLADVRANSPGKGRKLNKKQRETVIELAVADVRKVNLHVDI